MRANCGRLDAGNGIGAEGAGAILSALIEHRCLAFGHLSFGSLSLGIPKTFLPQELLSSSNGDILAYIRGVHEAGSLPERWCKLLIIGNTGRGKTSLAASLMGTPYVSGSTEGVVICKIACIAFACRTLTPSRQLPDKWRGISTV